MLWECARGKCKEVCTAAAGSGVHTQGKLLGVACTREREGVCQIGSGGHMLTEGCYALLEQEAQQLLWAAHIRKG
eukprot:1150844-Pelagomonas_calceolata.AAC.2